MKFGRRTDGGLFRKEEIGGVYAICNVRPVEHLERDGDDDGGEVSIVVR